MMCNRKTICYALASAAILFTGCRDDKDYYDPTISQKLVEECFDFKTTTDFNVTFNTGTKKLVRIYNANPQQDPNAKKIYAAFTDENGNYNGLATISSTYNGKTLYAEVDGKVYEVKATSNGLQLSTAANRAASRADVDYAQLASEIHDVFVDKLGEGYDNETVIMQLGGEKQEWDDDQKNNFTYKGIDVDIVTTEDTKLEVMFAHSGAGTGNTFTLYYYYHPVSTNTHREYNMDGGKFRDISGNEGWEKMANRFIQQGDKFRLWSGFNSGNFNNIKGDIKKLYYYGENLNETPSETFPENYQIGFVLVWNDTAGNNGRQRHKFTTAWANWSSKPDGSGWGCNRQATRFRYGDDILVYGIEDIGYNWVEVNDDSSCDRDFNDCIFAVITDQEIKSNTGGEIVDIKPVEPEPEPEPTEETLYYNGLLLFEDLFPAQGDYDMNDVVVEYQYAVTFGSDNIVKKVEATYTPIWDGADYSNAFGIQLEKRDGTILDNTIVFQDHKFGSKDPITGAITGQQETRTFTPNVHKDDLVFNPYIKVNNTGYEVHLTKMQPTATFAGSTLYNKLSYAQQNYVTTVGMVQDKFPYALDIRDARGESFTIVTERKRIDAQYPSFSNWVESDGNSSTDWWKQ